MMACQDSGRPCDSGTDGWQLVANGWWQGEVVGHCLAEFFFFGGRGGWWEGRKLQHIGVKKR